MSDGVESGDMVRNTALKHAYLASFASECSFLKLLRVMPETGPQRKKKKGRRDALVLLIAVMRRSLHPAPAFSLFLFSILFFYYGELQGRCVPVQSIPGGQLLLEARTDTP